MKRERCGVGLIAGSLVIGWLGCWNSSAQAADRLVVSRYTIDGQLVRRFGEEATTNSMHRVEVGPGGQIYLSRDRDNQPGVGVVAIYDPLGNRTGSLIAPNMGKVYGIGFTSDGSAFVGGNQRTGSPIGTPETSAAIYHFDTDGQFIAELQPQGNFINRYSDVKVSDTDRIYVAQQFSTPHNVFEMDPTGGVINPILNTGSDTFHDHLALSPVTGNLFDLTRPNGPSGGPSWLEFSPNGALLNTEVLGGNDELFLGLEVDPAGFVWTFNSAQQRLLRFNTNQSLQGSFFFGLDSIRDFTFTPGGDVLFIHRFDPDVAPDTAAWDNPGIGAQAGDWFDRNNWNALALPGLITETRIANGGEARADAGTATGDVQTGVFMIGPDGSVGQFTATGVNVTTGGDLEIGRAAVQGNNVATSGFGVAAITDTEQISIGSDIEVGNAFTAQSAVAVSTGFLDIKRVDTLLIDDDLTTGVAVANQTSSAGSRGFITLEDIPVIELGRGIDVGQAVVAGNGSATGEGSLTVSGTTDFIAGRDVMVGEARASNNGLANASGTADLSQVATVTIDGDLGVGVAAASTASSAESVGHWSLEGTSLLSIEDNLMVGVAQTSLDGGRATAHGDATIIGDGGQATIGEDLQVGSATYTSHHEAFRFPVATTNGQLTISNFDSMHVDDEFEVAVASWQGPITNDLPRTHTVDLVGEVTLTDIANLTIGRSMSIGTATFPDGSAFGDTMDVVGRLFVERVGPIDVAGDLSLAQAQTTLGARFNNAVVDATMLMEDVQSLTVGGNMNLYTAEIASDQDRLFVVGGTFVDRLGQLDVSGDLNIGTVTSTVTGVANIVEMESFVRFHEVGPISIGGNLSVADVQANDAGLTASNADVSFVDVQSMHVVGGVSVGVAHAENPGTQAPHQEAEGSLDLRGRGGGQLTIGADVLVGKAISPHTGRAETFGDWGAREFDSMSIGGVVEIGAVDAIAGGASGFTNRSVGNASSGLFDINTVTLGADLNIGIVRVDQNHESQADGQFTVVRVGSLDVAGDVNVGRIISTPSGQQNEANAEGQWIIWDSEVQIGGNLNVAVADPTPLDFETQVTGAVHLDNADVRVLGNVLLGQIGNGQGKRNLTARLSLADSTLHANRLSTAQSTLATPSHAQVTLTRSLIDLETNMVLGATSELVFDVDGRGRGTGYGAIDVGQVGILDGLITINLNFTPSEDSVFDLIVGSSANSLFGAFDDILIPDLDPAVMANAGLEEVLIDGQLTDVFRLHVLPPSPAGDANGDGIVDVADLGVVSANFGLDDRQYATGDFNGDGFTDIADLGVLAANWPGDNAMSFRVATEDVGLASAVPEPATVGLLTIGLGGLIRRRRSETA